MLLWYMRYLAIDHGEKRTGLAVCEATETMASPLVVVFDKSQLIGKIIKTIEEEEIEGLVIGLPLNMDGSEGVRVKEVRQFADELAGHISISITFFDERLSSFDALGKLAGLDLTRKKKKKHLDAVAAASFLQAFLDQKHGRQ
jgi:putative Holliday junction resolvase